MEYSSRVLQTFFFLGQEHGRNKDQTAASPKVLAKVERQQKKELLSRGCNVSNYQTFHYKNQAERDKSLISLLFCFEGEVLKRIGW